MKRHRKCCVAITKRSDTLALPYVVHVDLPVQVDHTEVDCDIGRFCGRWRWFNHLIWFVEPLVAWSIRKSGHGIRLVEAATVGEVEPSTLGICTALNFRLLHCLA